MKYKDGVYTSVHAIKKGVEITITFCDEIKAAILIADEISKRISGIEGVITAGMDGKHKTGSKHYSGEAFDFRINHYLKDGKIDTEMINLIVSELRKELVKDYDVVLHEGSHIHIEYDPK